LPDYTEKILSLSRTKNCVAIEVTYDYRGGCDDPERRGDSRVWIPDEALHPGMGEGANGEEQ
jgi:hypothetical protein